MSEELKPESFEQDPVSSPDENSQDIAPATTDDQSPGDSAATQSGQSPEIETQQETPDSPQDTGTVSETAQTDADISELDEILNSISEESAQEEPQAENLEPPVEEPTAQEEPEPDTAAAEAPETDDMQEAAEQPETPVQTQPEPEPENISESDTTPDNDAPAAAPETPAPEPEDDTPETDAVTDQADETPEPEQTDPVEQEQETPDEDQAPEVADDTEEASEPETDAETESAQEEPAPEPAPDTAGENQSGETETSDDENDPLQGFSLEGLIDEPEEVPVQEEQEEEKPGYELHPEESAIKSEIESLGKILEESLVLQEEIAKEKRLKDDPEIRREQSLNRLLIRLRWLMAGLGLVGMVYCFSLALFFVSGYIAVLNLLYVYQAENPKTQLLSFPVTFAADLINITILVHLTGEINSILFLLYFLLVAAITALSPLVRALSCTGITAFVYVLYILGGQYEEINVLGISLLRSLGIVLSSVWILMLKYLAGYAKEHLLPEAVQFWNKKITLGAQAEQEQQTGDTDSKQDTDKTPAAEQTESKEKEPRKQESAGNEAENKEGAAESDIVPEEEPEQ